MTQGRMPDHTGALAGAMRPRAVLGSVALGAFSLGAGLLLLKLAALETRWVVFLLGGGALGACAFLTDVRRALLTYFVFGLSVDAHYYLTPPRPPMYTGDTSPGGLSIPLALVPAMALLALRILRVHQGMEKFRFVPAFSRPTLLVLATASIATLLSPMWFTGLCVVWQLAALYALFLVTANEVTSDRDAQLVLKVLMAALLGQCAIFLLQLATGMKFNAVGRVVAEDSKDLWHQATGTAAITTAGFATFMQPLVALAYAKFRTANVRAERMFYASLTALGALVIVLTLNRSSLAGLPLGLMAVEALLRFKRLVKGRRTVDGRVVAIAIVLVFALLTGFALVQAKRPTSFWDDLEQRFDLMRPAFSMIRSHPVFGVGPGVYGYELTNHAGGHEGWLYIIHNDYLLLWAERGAVGLLAWLLWARAVFAVTLSPTTSVSRAVMGVGAAGGFVAHLWEVFWTACMSFPAYGVIYVLVGLCARKPVEVRHRAHVLERASPSDLEAQGAA
jgi:O-antigen ligase